MKTRVTHIGWLLLMAATIAGSCKSVPTTSAILYNEQGKFDLAIEEARKGLQRDPIDAEAYFQLGISYSNLDSVGMAFTNFMESARLDPKPSRKELVENNIKHNYSKHYNAGQAAFQNGDLHKASTEFALATEADPRQSVAFYNVGVTYSLLAEEDSSLHERAIDFLEEGLENSTPDQDHYVKAMRLLCKELIEIGRLDEAVSKCRRLTDEDPANYGVIESLGIDRIEREDWAGAEILLKAVAEARVRTGAEDFNVYHNLGRACYYQKDDDPDALRRAIEYYERALVLEPDETQTIMNLAIALMQREEWDEAAVWGEKYISLLPDSADGWRILSISYGKSGDKAKAAHCAEIYAEKAARHNQGQ